MATVCDEIVDFIAARSTSDAVAHFEPSQQTREYVAELIHKRKSLGPSPNESSELVHFMVIEYVKRLAKARAKTHRAS